MQESCCCCYEDDGDMRKTCRGQRIRKNQTDEARQGKMRRQQKGETKY